MSDHDDDTCPHFVVRTLLESEKQYTEQVRVENSILMKEVVLLKAEVERLRASSFVTAVPSEEYEKLQAENERLSEIVQTAHADLFSENASLKAEVERLTKDKKNADAYIRSIEAEVERLRKAGDAMADEIICCYKVEGLDAADSETLPKWNVAKEGKPSE